MTANILKHAWNVYRTNFGVIAAVILAICLPIDLLSSYMDYFVFDPDDFRKSFKLSRFLDNFIGIIATAAIIAVGYKASLGERSSFRNAMSTGLSSWGRMWWTRCLTGLAILLGLLLLIIPGLYLFVRLTLIEPVVVCERVSGSTAMRRSFELTKGRFWQLVLLGLVFGSILVAAIAAVVIPALFIPALDHWLVDAATSLVADFIATYGTLCLLSAYGKFSASLDMSGVGSDKEESS
jgi:uncharacterized membrane protein YesL